MNKYSGDNLINFETIMQTKTEGICKQVMNFFDWLFYIFFSLKNIENTLLDNEFHKTKSELENKPESNQQKDENLEEIPNKIDSNFTKSKYLFYILFLQLSSFIFIKIFVL